MYIIFIERHLADKEVMSVGRKNKKPPARKKMRKVTGLMIEVIKWLLATIAVIVLEHYLPIVLGW